MRKVFIILFFSLLFNTKLKAQEFYRNEVGIFLGGSYYVGDLNPSKHFLQTKFSGGFVYRYNITPRWTLKISALYGGLEASDSRSKANIDRNLSFKSYIFEFSPQIEFNFLQYILGDKKHFISPYIFLGASVFNFNPKAQAPDGTWWALQPLGTEGQGTTIEGAKKNYALTTIAIPFGLGVKISPAKFVTIGLEWGIRKTFTDYIDDVSTVYVNAESGSIFVSENGKIAAAFADRSLTNQGKHTGMERGNPRTKDWYVFTGLTATFRIKTKSERCPAYKQHPRIKIKYKD
ncbi:MAG: DUF6089 family protein [Bacteroidota bacterium]